MHKILTLVFTFIVFLGCSNNKKDINIGIAMGLTGKYANLGTSERDGILTALNEVNYTIDSRRINLIIKDDKQDKNTDKKVIKELIQQKIKIIIGNATSSMTKITLETLQNHKDILLFSPTASSSIFTNKDDNLIRLESGHTKDKFTILIDYIKKHHFKNIVLIKDPNNKTYTKDYVHMLDNCNIKYAKILDSTMPYNKLISHIKNADFIFLVTNKTDTANLIQYIRVNKIDADIISSGWGKSQEVIENIGRYTKNLYFFSSLEADKETKSYKTFKKHFTKLYNKNPDNFNTKGYIVAKIIIDAIKHNHFNSLEIKKYILNKKIFNIAGKKIVFNKFGDICESYHLFKITKHHFYLIK